MDKKIVKEIALANGFKLKEQPDGSLELNPYVYVFADKLVEHQQAKVEELTYKANLRESDHQALLVKYQATKKCWEDISKEKAELQKRVDALIQKYKDEDRELKLIDEWEQSQIYGLVASELEQALKGEATPNLNIDLKGECRHFSTTMFHEGKAECFHCDAVVNEDREVIGKQSKGFSWPAKERDQ